MSFHSVGRGSATQYFNKINEQLSKLKDTPKGQLAGRVSQPGYLPNRIPWIMSTTEWLEEGYGIHWWSNPSDISWNIRLRQSTSKNANSTVTHVWANNNRGTHFDEFVLNFSLQSGNLIPYNRNNPGGPNDQSKDIIAPGLVNFYDFLKLLDAPKLTRDGRTNHVIIKYNSTIFPSLTLIGQFEPEGVKFNDSASDPTNINSWSCSFVVYDSNPRLADNTRNQSNSDLLSKALDNMYYGKGGSYKSYDYLGENYSGGLDRDADGISRDLGIKQMEPIKPQEVQQISGLGFSPFTGFKK